MKTDCDACQGIESLTPETVANRPGLPALRYRAGTHGSILESMIAKLSVFGAERAKAEAARNPDRRPGQPVPPPSTWLRSREPSDPTLALLDAWSTVGDILTFYQERIANEGYLPTARELRSLHELASQVGYRLRPALSSSVYLAFDVQAPPALDLDVPPAPPHEVLIPKGTQSRHIPGPGELPQVFETMEDLTGRPEWNQLRPRLTKPTVIDAANSRNLNKLRLNRIDLALQPGDLLLLVCQKDETPALTEQNTNNRSASDRPQTVVRRIKSVEIDSKRQQTVVNLLDSPFSLVAYRDAIVRAAVQYQDVLQRATFEDSSALLTDRAKTWNDAGTKILGIAVDDTKTLVATDREVFEAFKDLRLTPPPASRDSTSNWSLNAVAYAVACKAVDDTSALLRTKVTNLFVSLASNQTSTGWKGTFESLKRVGDVLSAYNPIVRDIQFHATPNGSPAVWTVGQLKARVNDLVSVSNGLDSDAIQAAAKSVLNQLENAVISMLSGSDSNDTLNDNQLQAVKSAVDTYGDPVAVTLLLSEWHNLLTVAMGTNPIGRLLKSLWTLPIGSSDLPATLGNESIWADSVADRTPDSTTGVGNAAEVAFVTSLQIKRTQVINDITNALASLASLSHLNIVVGDTKELQDIADSFKPLNLTDCVNEAFYTLLKTESPTDLRIKKNKTAVDSHFTTSAAILRAWEQASVPAASAVVSILNDTNSQLGTDGAVAKDFLNKKIAEINGYSTGSAPASRLDSIRTALFLQDKSPPNLPELDPVFLRSKLADWPPTPAVPAAPAAAAPPPPPKISGPSLELLIVRLQEIDTALRTPAPRSARTAFLFTQGIEGANDILRLLQDGRNGDGSRGDINQVLQGSGDIIARLMKGLKIEGVDQLIATLGQSESRVDTGKVFSFSSRTGLFGASAPQSIEVGAGSDGDPVTHVVDPTTTPATDEDVRVLFLDQDCAGVTAGGWCLVGQMPGSSDDSTAVLPFGSESLFPAFQIKDATRLQRNAYKQSGKSVRLELDQNWITLKKEIPTRLRSTIVFASSQELTVADEVVEVPYPVTAESSGNSGQEQLGNDGLPKALSVLELDEFYADLETNRVLLLSGETVVLPNDNSLPLQTKSQATHYCKLVSAVSLPDERGRMKTTLQISPPLRRRFVRDTVRIYANVVEATNGATVEEVIGNGEGQGQFQRFLLSQPQLTYLPAETASGMKPEIEVRVNNVAWDLGENVGELRTVVVPGRPVGGVPQRAALPRLYLATVDDGERTFLTTGDGMTTGERLPTGITNVRAIYRVGGGRGGNVGEGTITQLASPPLNVTKVRNLMAASGGVDREDVDQARKNVPLAVMALDRLVSVVDYESFVRKFAGIAKAQAKVLSINGQNTVVVTIAGLDDIPVVRDSLLYRNLVTTVKKFADPEQAVLIEPRELLLLLTQARIKVEDNHLFEVVKEEVRQRILKRFTFERAELGESVLLSDLIETIQNTPGVRYVDVDMFDRMRQFYGTAQMVAHATKITEGIAQSITPSPRQQPQDYIVAQRARENADLEGHLPQPAAGAKDERVVDKPQGFTCLPAQLAYFADLAGTILLKEIK